MVRRYYNLPSLTALAVFEASARHMNFNRAGMELNVTRGAVSRQIKALEDELGVALFDREAKGVHLTADGEALYAVLARGFSEAAETVHAIRTGSRQSAVTLACTNAFATLWLMPHMGSFWQRHPGIDVHHLMSDRAQDFRRAEIDLRIRYGFGAWPDEEVELLFSEKIFPVCGPCYLAQHRDCAEAAIGELPLLHVEGVDPEWTNWDEFLRRAGVPHGPLQGRQFNNFSVLLQATQDDQGVALGWERLVRPLLADGKLVRFGALEIDAPGAYYLTWNVRRTLSESALVLKDWLLETARADDAEG
jgi:LysR family glycine cleavage system transcriptional activator